MKVNFDVFKPGRWMNRNGRERIFQKANAREEVFLVNTGETLEALIGNDKGRRFVAIQFGLLWFRAWTDNVDLAVAMALNRLGNNEPWVFPDRTETGPFIPTVVENEFLR